MPVDESRIRPQMQRGRLEVYPSQTRGTQKRDIPFQYNPEQLRRTLAARTPQATSAPRNEAAARANVLNVTGPPVETINLAIVLSAADQLADPARNREVAQKGLHPVLATLELLLHPSSRRLADARDRARRGERQIAPLDIPLVVLWFGDRRQVPVTITSFSVSEEHFDRNLNPIQARVELALRVLTTKDVAENTIGYDVYVAYQRGKERLATPPGASTPATAGA